MSSKPSRRLPHVHPGQILHSEFLAPLGMSQNGFAREISVPPKRINEIVHGKRNITADTALRLARRLGTSPQFWMNLQTHFDLEVAGEALGRRLQKEVQPHAA